MNTLKKSLCLILCLCTTCFIAYAEELANKKELSAKQFFSHYLDAYNQFDAKAAAHHYHSQVNVTGIGSALRVSSRDDMQKTLGAFLQRMKDDGVAKFEWQTLQVTMLGNNTAISSNVVARYNETGKFYNNGAATMIAHKVDNNWQIFSLHLHSVDALLPIAKQG